MIKKVLKILWLLAVAVTAAVLALVLALQAPQVQTYFTRSLMEKVSGKIDGKVEFEKIHFKPFNALIIKNISVIDTAPVIEGMDTLFHAEYVIARFSLRGLVSDDGLTIRRVYISDAFMNLAVKDKSVNLMRMFGLKQPEEKKPNSGKPIFTINRVNLNNITFRLKNESEKRYNYPGSGINWNDLEVTEINAYGRRLNLTGNIMTGTLDFLSFKEKSGYVCNAISGYTRTGDGRAEIRDIRLSDPWSELYIPEYTMTYDWGRDFSNYVELVHMYGNIAESNLDMKTLGYFVPVLEHMDLNTRVSGIVAGTVTDLNIADLRLKTEDGAGLHLSGRLTGLPDVEKMNISANINNLSCSMADIAGLLKDDAAANIRKFAKGARFHAKAKANGTLDDLTAHINVGVDSGYVSADARITDLLTRNNPIGIKGTANSHNFDIGKIIGSTLVRQCSMETAFNAIFTGEGFTGFSANIDSLKVHRLKINDYDYSGIAAVGKMETKSFDGRIICNDPNLNFLLQGIFSLSPKTNNALYKFYANVGYADLNAMNIDKRGLSKVSLRTTANFNKIDAGDILGSVEVDDVLLENNLGKHDIGKISLTSHSSENLYRLNLDSDFANAAFSGSNSFMTFIKDLRDITLKREIPALFRDSTETYKGDRYYFTFRNHDSRELMAYFMPGMYLADSTNLEMRIDSTGIFSARLTSPRIAYNEHYIRNLDFDFNNKEDVLGGRLSGKTIRLTTVDLENSRFQLFVNDNFIGLGYDYENSGDLINRGEIIATARVRRGADDRPAIKVEFLPSRIFLNSEEWTIHSSFIDVAGGAVDIDNCRFTSGDQLIHIDGAISNERRDTLGVRLERFNIDILNSLIGEEFAIAGAATGRARIISAPGDKHFLDKSLLLGFSCEETSFAGTPVGTLRLGCEWNEKARHFDMVARNELDGVRTFDVKGNYAPASKWLNMTADLDKFDISYIKPFTEVIFSDIQGHLSGEISAEGPVNALTLSSRDARIDDSRLKIAFTNVPYNASGPFHLDDEGVHFDQVTVTDRHGNRGSVTGGIALNGFKDIRFDTHINVREMECLDLDEDDNPMFYGHIFGSGNLHLTGKASSVRMDIDATTSGNGQLHIPLTGSATAVSSDLLTFKQEEKYIYVDPYEEMMKKINPQDKRKGDLRINARVAATPGVEALLEIDKASGNVIRGTGSGLLDLEINNNNFDIYGDYNITSGNYRFVAQGLAYRDFSIQDGSSVKFNGDVMETTLDIDAIYRTKTSLSALIADTSSVATRRTVECGINISDKISNPRLAFSINVPDLDPTVKSRVESALSTEDKVQKQFLALIVFNNFLPDEQSGIVNNTSMLYSTVSELVYNQLNNILQKLDIPLDLGLNYQVNERGQDFFDVAVSTQLFNNRVVVNGNIGNRQYTSSSNSSVAGDIDIEIKLDRAGLLRLNLFSHSSDQYTNYLDNSQRNGVGLAYQREFNTFKEFFRDLFTSRKKREEREAAEAASQTVQERKTVKIEDRTQKKKKKIREQ